MTSAAPIGLFTSRSYEEIDGCLSFSKYTGEFDAEDRVMVVYEMKTITGSMASSASTNQESSIQK